LTERLYQVGRILRIEVRDHVVITPDNYFSFKDGSIMDDLKESLLYVPTYEAVELIRKEEKKIREKAVKQAEKKALAKGLRGGCRNVRHKAKTAPLTA
jgi:DNA repair protein RadC